jgi:hypothetical protein
MTNTTIISRTYTTERHILQYYELIRNKRNNITVHIIAHITNKLCSLNTHKKKE